MLKDVAKRLEEKDITLIVDNAVRYFLTDQGYDPIYGARPLRRAVTKILEDRLAMECLNYDLVPGTIITVTQEMKDTKDSTNSFMESFYNIYTENINIDVDITKADKDDIKRHEAQKKWRNTDTDNDTVKKTDNLKEDNLKRLSRTI